MGLVCESISIFRLYDADRIRVSIAPSRTQSRYGVWAQVTSLGEAQLNELYLMTFFFPRFFLLNSRERMETLVHELYHLHPQFDGRLRKFPRPHIYHGPTPSQFRRRVTGLTQEALNHLPSLNSHPLICQGPDYFRNHSQKSITRKTAVRTSSRKKGNWLPLLVFSFFLISQLSWGQSSEAYKPPSVDDFIPKGTEAPLNSSKNETPIPRDPTAKFFASRDSKLFAQPSKFAERFAIIQKGDEITPLALSSGMGWTRIRLLLTGEEGWYPSSWISRENLKTAEESGPLNFSVHVGWVTGGYQLAAGTSVTFDLLRSKLISEKGLQLETLERFELGPEYFFLNVSDYNRLDRLITSQAWSLGLMFRYSYQYPQTPLVYEILGSGLYYKQVTVAQGISDSVLISEGIDPVRTRVGFSAGFGVSYQISKYFYLGGRVRALLIGDFVWWPQGVLDVRF